LTELDSDLLSEFGAALFRKRNKLGKNQSQIKSADVGVISKLENGKPAGISAKVVSRIVQELDMGEEWTDRFIEFELAKKRKRTDQILKFADADDLAKSSAKELLLGLADKFAGDDFQDAFSAYQALRSALEEAEKLKTQGTMPHNLGDQMQAVLQRVAAHNDQGEFDAGQDEFTNALKRADADAERIMSEKIAIYNHATAQAQLQNDPELAAQIIVARLTLEARPEGLNNAVAQEGNALIKAYYGQTSRFFRRVQLALAEGSLKRAKGPNKAWGYFNLAINQRALAHQENGVERLEAAYASCKAAIKMSEKHGIPVARARALAELANCLQMIWERTDDTPDPQMVKAARTAYRLVLETPSAKAQDRAHITTTLAEILADLGQGEADSNMLDEALIRFEEAMGYFADWGDDGAFYAESAKTSMALAQLRRGRVIKSMANLGQAATTFNANAVEQKETQPYYWAIGQWNLADLALAKWEVGGDLAQLIHAQTHLNDARAVFEQGLSEFQLNKCDELQAQIDAARR
jgi:transcriptional regulator with XRE-family HTH domain